MKKLILLLAVLTCGLVACEGPMGPQGPKGEPGEPGESTYWNVEKFTLRSNHWDKYTNNDNPKDVYYKAVVEFEFPGWDMDDKTAQFIYNNGTTFAYVYRVDKDNNESQTPLTYIQNWSNNRDESIVDTYYFDYTPYDIAIYYAPSGEGANQWGPEDDLQFRVVMNW